MPNLVDTDEEIAARVQGGETESFALLVERYEAKMLRYARRFLFGFEDAEDLAQEVFIKAYINIQGFNTRRRFSPWLYRIAHNEFINAIKKRRRAPLLFFDPDTIFPQPVSADRADRDFNEQELRAVLEECLQDLDPKYREPLVLYFFEELDYRQISDIMELPVSTVGIRLKRGKDMLREIYKKKYPFYE